MPHNNTRHKSSVALILIDVINHFEFPDGDALLKNALPMAARLAKLKERCRKAGIPAIYVNDNFGQWRSDAKMLLARCLDSNCVGKPFVERVRPGDDDYFVLKPMHSAFYQTPLEILLRYLGASSSFSADLRPIAALSALRTMPGCEISSYTSHPIVPPRVRDGSMTRRLHISRKWPAHPSSPPHPYAWASCAVEVPREKTGCKQWVMTNTRLSATPRSLTGWQDWRSCSRLRRKTPTRLGPIIVRPPESGPCRKASRSW